MLTKRKDRFSPARRMNRLNWQSLWSKYVHHKGFVCEFGKKGRKAPSRGTNYKQAEVYLRYSHSLYRQSVIGYNILDKPYFYKSCVKEIIRGIYEKACGYSF